MVHVHQEFRIGTCALSILNANKYHVDKSSTRRISGSRGGKYLYRIVPAYQRGYVVSGTVVPWISFIIFVMIVMIQVQITVEASHHTCHPSNGLSAGGGWGSETRFGAVLLSSVAIFLFSTLALASYFALPWQEVGSIAMSMRNLSLSLTTVFQMFWRSTAYTLCTL